MGTVASRPVAERDDAVAVRLACSRVSGTWLLPPSKMRAPVPAGADVAATLREELSALVRLAEGRR